MTSAEGPGARYTYGDSELAAERLGLIAATFEPTTRSFLERVRPARAPVGLALDLGCGPGHTTRLLHEVLGPARTVGLDASGPYVMRARRAAGDGVDFAVHDATAVPFPLGPPDVVYARLLLAHLPSPAGVVARWANALAKGGVLLLDDLEAIETQEPACRAYLDEVALPVVRAQGGELLVGPTLHAMADPPGTVRDLDDVATFTPPAAVSARIFEMNLAVLVERHEIAPRPDLAEALGDAAGVRRTALPTTWHVRQLAFRRNG